MAEYLRVKNWDEFQQYKDRDPKWIKVHRDLLYDYELDRLDENAQIHLVKIWLLAAKLDNRIPNDPTWIARQIGAKSKVDINQLCTAGFLIAYSSVQGRTETYLETEEETETEKTLTPEPAVPACPHLDIIAVYHEVLPERPQVLPARWQGSASAKHLQARWRENAEHRDLDFWRQFFEAVRTNDWWMRGKEDGWRGVDLHWLVRRGNFDKVVQHWSNLS